MAIFDFVFTTAVVSSVTKIRRRSLAFYGPEERAFIDNNVYNSQYPKILILEGENNRMIYCCILSLCFGVL